MDNSKSLKMVPEEGTATNPLRDTLKYVISDKCNATIMSKLTNVIMRQTS